MIKKTLIIAHQHSRQTRDIDTAILSVYRFFCLSRFDAVSERLNVIFFQHLVAQLFYFLYDTSLRNSDGVTHCGGVEYRFSTNIWVTIQDRAIVTVEK